MSELTNSYWGENGKYQDLADKLGERAPGYGYTSNVYVNMYLVMAHLYYDAYNNGGGNIDDSYVKDFHFRVEPYLGDKVKIEPFLNEDFATMESMVNTVFEFIMDKNLDFPIYSFWCNHDIQAISDYEPEGELLNKGYWFKATFGEPEEMDNFKKTWCLKYEDLSEKFSKEDLDSVIKSCEDISKAVDKNIHDNEYYKTSDGFFDFYVSKKTGEKKFQLEDGDVEVSAVFDDFSRDHER